MNAKKVRNAVFAFHRYLGLAIGLIIILIGLTGSLLVFEQDFDRWMVAQQYGPITPQPEQVSPEAVINTIQAKYAAQKDLKMYRMYLPDVPDAPYIGQLATPDGQGTEVFVNPYTGAILGARSDKTLIRILLELHYSLMAGETGVTIIGVAAFLLCILSLTGLILWPGWRKLIAGFKIKWNAHPKRVNFDIHKVVGVITVVFLFLTAFTGFCWNFYGFTEPIIYAVTFTQKPPDVVSKPIPGQSPLSLTKQLSIANATLPGAVIRSMFLPEKPEDVLDIRMQLPQERVSYGNSHVYLDQYSGEVLRVDNALRIPLGDRVLNFFVPLHYGTFGGLPTRILYVFVGLAPLILFITGFIMWYHRPSRSTHC